MTENKSWRDYSSSKRVEESTEKLTNNKETGSWRDYSKLVSGSGGGQANDWRNYSDLSTASIVGDNIVSRVNTWHNNHNSLVSDHQRRYAGRKYSYEDSYVSDSADWLDEVARRKSSLDEEADAILSYMDQYKDYLDDEWMSKVRKNILGIKSDQGKILTVATQDNEWWSGFGSEELVGKYGSAEEAYKYNQRTNGYYKKYEGMSYEELSGLAGNLDDGEEKDWLNSYVGSIDYENKKNLDIATAEQEIAEWEGAVERYGLTFKANWMDYFKTEEERDAYRDFFEENYWKKYGGEDAMFTALAAKRAYVDHAKRIQETVRLSSVADSTSELYDPEFEKYAHQGAAFENPTVADYVGFVSAGSWNPWGEDPKNKVTYTRDNWDKYVDRNWAGVNMAGGHTDPASYGFNELYTYMEEDEVQIYNYYLAKYGEEAADKYLDALESTLESRKAYGMYERVGDNFFKQWAFAATAGLDQFASGMSGFWDSITGNEEYKAPSAVQQASGMIRNDMKDTGPKLPDWMGGASLGQVVYDETTTAANMVPSILASVAANAIVPGSGAIVGAGLMGASASGNAYTEVINMGYGKDEARTYATMVGVSEASLQYVLGGVGNLGGMSSKITKAVAGIDNGLLRFSLKFGGKIASETLEEGLQEILDPIYKNAVLHADEDIDWSEVAYSALLGGLSGGVFESVGTATETIGEQRLKKSYGSNTSSIIREGLDNGVNSESYELATKYKAKTDAGKTLTGAEIRQLLEANQKEISPNALHKIQKGAEATAEKSLKYQATKVNNAILSLVNRVKQGLAAGNERVQLTPVSDHVATKIKELTGIDVRGYKVEIEARQIDHILQRHGERGAADHSMANADDIAKIEFVLNDPDSIVNAGTTRAYVTNKDGKMKPARTVLYEKQNGDGSYYVVQAVPDTNKKTLYIVTAFIGEPGYKKTEATQSTNAYSPDATPEAESVIASNNSIPNTSEVVNPDIASPENSTTSVGAAPAGFDPLTHAMLEYGNIPEGENAIRDDSLPVSMDGESKVSHVARTVMGAEATPDAFAEEVRNEVANGNLSYIPITNDATVQKVEQHIQKVGWQEAYTEWVSKVEKGVTGAEMTATGAVLLNNAANAGDHESWRNVLYHFQKLGTNTAQGLQAFRILKTLSPSDKLWMIKKSAQQMVDDLGIKNVEIELDKALVDEYDKAQTDEQREAALDEIIDSVAAQIRPTFTEKLNSYRYTMMLGNLRTQIRNLTGNASMAGITSMKNIIATSLEHLVHAVSGGKTERTKSFTVSREMMRSGMQDYDSVESIIKNGGRYALHDNTASDITQRIQDKRTMFRFKPMEGYRKLTNWAMDKGDVLFSKPAYARALAGYLKAHGVTDADFSKVDAELMDNARLYAVKEAQEQTFHDTNAISQWVSRIGRGPNTPKWMKPAIEGILPFRKTPANIAVRSWEYSPMGLINSVVDTVNAARSGSDTTVADAINSWAKALTGTGLVGLGMLLQSLGLIRGAEEDDEQRAFDSLSGWQEYSFVIPGTSINFTLDAFSSASMPLLVGAQLKSIIDGEGISLDQVLSCLSALADPMVDMSLMQGFKGLLEDIRYSEEPMGQIFINSCVDYLTQFLTNSVVGQLERGTEKQRMQTYVDPNSSVPDWLQKALGAISAKTPGWDYQQIPYINAWGETEETPTGLNLLETTVSPMYFDQGEKTPLTEELNRLYNDAHQDGVYPSRPDKTVSYTDKNGVRHEKYGLNAEEYVDIATKQGQTQKRILEDLIASDSYKNLPDAYKAIAIEKAYYYAQEIAREQVLTDYAPFAKDAWMGSISGSEAEAILNRVHLAYLTDQVIPEAGYQKARQVQIVEQIAGADEEYTEDEQETMLLATLTDSKAKAYEKVKGMGYDIDDFAAVYRIYQKAEDSKSYGKADAIRDIMRELHVSENTATLLYEAYQKPNG